MNQTFRNLGSAVGPVIAATVTASYMTTTYAHVAGFPVLVPVPTYSIVGFQFVFGITAAVALVGLLLSLGLKNFRFLADGSRTGHTEPGEAGAPRFRDEPGGPVGVQV